MLTSVLTLTRPSSAVKCKFIRSDDVPIRLMPDVMLTVFDAFKLINRSKHLLVIKRLAVLGVKGSWVRIPPSRQEETQVKG